MSKANADEVDWQKTLIEHDSAIKGLSADMSGLKVEVQGIHKAMNSHHSDLSSKFDKIMARSDARPDFDPHKWIGTILSIAVLFGIIVGGIIYVSNAQFAGTLAKQEAFNDNVKEKLGDHDKQITDQGQALAEVGRRAGWAAALAKRAQQ